MERVSKYDLKWVLGVYNKWNWGAHDELRYTLPGGPGYKLIAVWPWEGWLGWSKAGGVEGGLGFFFQAICISRLSQQFAMHVHHHILLSCEFWPRLTSSRRNIPSSPWSRRPQRLVLGVSLSALVLPKSFVWAVTLPAFTQGKLLWEGWWRRTDL